MNIAESIRILFRNSFIEKIKEKTNQLETKLKNSNLPPILKKRKIQVSIIITVMIFLLWLLIGTLPAASINIPTYLVKKDNFLVAITESGEVRAKNAVSVSAPRVRGNLKITYMVPEGTYVKGGDVVVRFDPVEALTQLEDAASRLEIANSDREKLLATQKSVITRMESDLRSSELSYELSKLNLEQIKFEAEVKQREAMLNHQRNELSFQKANQDFESQKIVNQSELNKMDIEVRQRRSNLENAKRDLEQLTLTAPTEGLVVYERNWSTGRKFTIGDTPWGNSTLISLPDLSTMESFTYVNEVDISRVTKGQTVHIRLDAFQDSMFTGSISSVAALGRSKDGSPNIKIFEITVDIDKQSEILKPGMTTSNKIIINEIPDVLFIPQEAVYEKENNKIVYVKKGSSFSEIIVKVGDKSENYIVITEGLEEGDEVGLRNPNLSLEDQQLHEAGSSSVEMPNS